MTNTDKLKELAEAGRYTNPQATIDHLVAEVERLRVTLNEIQQDLPYVMGFNAGFDHAMRETLKLKFPTMLRKMWSGGEVQQWLEKAKAEARAALEGKP